VERIQKLVSNVEIVEAQETKEYVYGVVTEKTAIGDKR